MTKDNIRATFEEIDRLRKQAATHPLEDALPGHYTHCPHCGQHVNPESVWQDAEAHPPDCPLELEEDACLDAERLAKGLERSLLDELRSSVGLPIDY